MCRIDRAAVRAGWPWWLFHSSENFKSPSVFRLGLSETIFIAHSEVFGFDAPFAGLVVAIALHSGMRSLHWRKQDGLLFLFQGGPLPRLWGGLVQDGTLVAAPRHRAQSQIRREFYAKKLADQDIGPLSPLTIDLLSIAEPTKP